MGFLKKISLGLLLCIDFATIVLGDPLLQECIDKVRTIFGEDKTPREHFLFGLENYNDGYFTHSSLQVNLKAEAYFEWLISNIDENDLKEMMLPSHFCSDERPADVNYKLCRGGFVLLMKIKGDNEQELQEKFDKLKNLEVFQYLYTYYINKESDYRTILFPRSEEVMQMPADVITTIEYLRRNKDTVVRALIEYFKHVKDLAEKIDENRFPSVETVCETIKDTSDSG